jgi:peptidoglycan hydrolase-like protein with peptidoglycan-binding domain
MRSQKSHIDSTTGGRRGDLRLPFVFQLLGWSARDAVGSAVAIFAASAILINVLFLQASVHPAPIFKPAEAPTKAVGAPDRSAAATSVMRRPEPIPTPAPRTPVTAPAASPRMPGEIIMDIQRELSRRGFYDGPMDGLYGPKTDAAIRDFEQMFGLKPSAQPNEALLQAILRSATKAGKGVTGTVGSSGPRTENAVEPAASSQRVIALQRALAEFGYGQIRPNGIVDADTQRAIERFERERRMPPTGQVSDRVIRELAAATGRPLE